jgi:hypothetical protein
MRHLHHLSLLCLLVASCNSDGSNSKSGSDGPLADNYVLGATGGKVPQPTEFALFNGKDLSNWDFELSDKNADISAVWSVQDGILICKGTPTGYLRTQKPYGDYELTVVYRWAPGTQGGNSGVLLHASTPRELGIWPKCLESQLEAGSAGDFWQLGETIEVADADVRQKGRRIMRHTDDVEKPLGEWNTMVVRCNAADVSVTVNGTPTNAGTHGSAESGAICFQSEGAEIHFKQISLQSLR